MTTTQKKISDYEISLLNGKKQETFPTNDSIAPEKEFSDFLTEGYNLLQEKNPKFASLQLKP